LSLKIPDLTTQPLTTLLTPEGTYRELAGDRDFILTYIPGLRKPIRAYKAHRNNPTEYSNNPNYQASFNEPYYHRILTEIE